ncbi:MAG: insulinase family protein [Candidatus Eisenbacteria bacterium]|uniref:Insulinase family protein n=1 Tax=Eiseniibacteriota bacterium TaxID=2212470 RepID=A0A9D6L847_UNCEI|nr:insulinase family protein [Candidatus Eisenbacteria bacterium]MBI3540476.1 insulinase family protein [Candidatus Eisenbacteria bacterium]
MIIRRPIAAVLGRAVRAAVPAVTLAALALAAAPAAAAPVTAPHDAAAPALITLKNGVRLLLAPDPAATAVDVAAWIDAGVRYERPGQIGISHLVEHLATAATVIDGMDDAKRIAAEGGTGSAYTNADWTCFSHTVPRGALDVAFRLEAARLALQPTEAQLRTASAGVRDEIRARARANPVEGSLERLYGAAFTAHPYRWPVLGLDADLERVTLGQCVEFLHQRYTPDHLLITVAGDFDPDEALALARRHLEPIHGRGESRTPAAEPPSPHRGDAPGEFQVPILVVGWRADAADAPALDCIASLIAQGPLARLYQRLVAGAGRCVLVDAGRDGRRDATMFWTIAALEPGADSASVERDLLAEMDALGATPVGGDEMDRVRRRASLAMLFGRQTASDRGQALGTAQMIAGDAGEADRAIERLRALAPADLQQAAARTFTAARRTVVWIRPAAGSRP